MTSLPLLNVEWRAILSHFYSHFSIDFPWNLGNDRPGTRSPRPALGRIAYTGLQRQQSLPVGAST